MTEKPGVRAGAAASASPLAGVVSIALAGVFLLHALHYSFLMDDAFISFRYARNLVEGHGLVFNPGERVEGYSNLAWLLVVAGGMAAGITPEVLSRVLGIVSALVVLGIVFHLARRWLAPGPGLPWAAFIPVLLLICNRSFAAWSTSGLETRFFTALLLGTLLALDVELERGSPFIPWSAGLLALAVSTRVDGFVPAGVIVAGVWLARRLRPGRHGLVLLAALVVPLVAHTLFRIAYYGDALPNTYRVKIVGLALEQGFRYLGRAFSSYPLVLGLLLAAVAAWTLRRRTPVAWIALALVAVQLAYVACVGGDHFEFRMLDPIWPPLMLLAAVGAVRAARGASRRARIAAWAGLAGLGAWNLVPAYTGFADTYETVSVETEARFCERWAEVGRWFREHAAPDEVIALRPSGVIPYESGLRTLDMHGLNDRTIALRPPDPEATAAGHRKFATWEDVLVRARTDYLIDEPRITAVAPPRSPPTLLQVGGRRFALFPERVKIAGFWLEFFIVSEDTDPSRAATRIRPGRRPAP